MKAAGIPLKRLTLPVILCGALLSVGCFLLQERVQPEAMRRANELIYGELLERVTLDVLPAGVMHEIGGMRIFFEDRDSASKTLRGVVLVQPKTGGDRVFYADEAQFVDSPDGAILVLRRGQIVFPLEGDNVAATQFTERRESIQSAARRFAPSQRKAMTFSELLEKERAAVARHTASPSRQNAENLRLTRAEIGERVSLPLACLAVSIVAAPFAARARPAAAGGRSYSFAIGFIIVGAYYLIRLFVEADDVRPLAECVLRGMTPNFALAVVGIAALWRVDRV